MAENGISLVLLQPVTGSRRNPKKCCAVRSLVWIPFFMDLPLVFWCLLFYFTGGSSKWVKGVIGVAVAVAVIMIVGGSGGGCAAYIYYLIPKRMSGILDWALRNCSTMIGISNEQHTPGNAEDGSLSRRYSRSVQERVRGTPLLNYTLFLYTYK